MRAAPAAVVDPAGEALVQVGAPRRHGRGPPPERAETYAARILRAQEDERRHLARVGMSMGMGPSGGTPNVTSRSGPGAAMRPAGAPASSGTAGNPAAPQALKLVVDPPPLFGVRNPAAGDTVDAIVPATIILRAGAAVELTIQNWDTMAHAWSVAGLGLNVTVPFGSHTSPSTVAVDLVPSRAGRFVWQSTTNSDSSSMANPGYMTGVVTVSS